jgi:hypothetical protein
VIGAVARTGGVRFIPTVPQPDNLEITLDFDAVQRGAERVRDMLLDARRRFDLSRFEYSTRVRIAPTEIPHSHPRITLNTWVRDDLGLLSMYLHEQMHWYVTWYSHARAPQWRQLFSQLRERYPAAPVGGTDGANDAFSTYLHLLVNWLEVEAVSQFINRDRVVQHVRLMPFYRWIYQTVIDDWQLLEALYRDQGLLPFREAAQMSPDELTLAALMDEVAT